MGSGTVLFPERRGLTMRTSVPPEPSHPIADLPLPMDGPHKATGSHSPCARAAPSDDHDFEVLFKLADDRSGRLALGRSRLDLPYFIPFSALGVGLKIDDHAGGIRPHLGIDRPIDFQDPE